MEREKIKCSLKKHNEIEAIIYCYECKVYFCNKCENFHSEIFENHHLYKLDKITNKIFTGFCQEDNHFDKLDYFCYTHKQLCCAACIAKIKHKSYGQHKNCKVCIIEDIIENKKKI